MTTTSTRPHRKARPIRYRIVRASEPGFRSPLIANAIRNVATRSACVRCKTRFTSPDQPAAFVHIDHGLHHDWPGSIGFVCKACEGEDDEQLAAAAVESVFAKMAPG